MKEKIPYKLKTIDGVGLEAAISIGPISERETDDTLAFPFLAGDYLGKVPELTIDYFQSNYATNVSRHLNSFIILII